jgi:hypothetical protein
MLRGSRPGERRGGRERGTPNRRTILGDRILAIGLDHPAASQRAFLRKLVKDRKLPAETRMAVAPQCFPPKRRRPLRAGRSRLTAAGAAAASNGAQIPAVVPATGGWPAQVLDAFLGVVQDAAVNPKARRKAALKIAEFLLPKVPKKAKVIADEYGFAISPKLASAYRDIQLELRTLNGEPTRKIPAIAEKIKKLEARSAAIRRRLQVPCPSRYGTKEAHEDAVRLGEFAALRYNNKATLNEAQQAEEAHVRARFDVYCAGPESIARGRRAALAEADRRYRMYRLIGGFAAPPLSRKDRTELKRLRWLYPAEPRNRSERDDEFEMRHHPFADELPAPDGHFYPRHSKRRAAAFANGMVYLEWPKARIYALEKRRVAEELSPAEEEELQDLRRRHPRIAEVVSQMNLVYEYWYDYEFKIATRAGLDIDAAIRQARDCCLRFEKVGCISKSPGPPFSASMNSTPAFSSARRTA